MSPWKKDFPVFQPNAQPNLVYLDSAATCLTPRHVADAMYHYQCYSHANSHKGMYQLSAAVTNKVEGAREKVAQFIGAQRAHQIVFTTGTTESLNMVAHSKVELLLAQAANDGIKANIIVSAAEHHANLLPWQNLIDKYQAKLRIAPLNNEGIIDVIALDKLIDSNTVAIAICHSSNVIGRVNPIKTICQLAKKKGVISIVDGAQAITKGDVDVSDLDCDFYAFSGHKLYGPTGCGVLYIKHDNYESLRPYQLGGGIITTVNFHQSEFLNSPLKLEPGSHNVAAIVGLVEAIDYLEDISWQDINRYQDSLSRYLHASLTELKYYRPLIQSAEPPNHYETKLPTINCFQIDSVHCHDVASILDSESIAVRAGHHCAQPLHRELGVKASVRVSIGLYNDNSDIDRLVSALESAHQLMAF